MKNEMEINGRIREYIDGELVNEQSNAIQAALYNHLSTFLVPETIDNTTLIGTEGENPNSQGTDGIMLYDTNSAAYLTMVTTMGASGNNWEEFLGEITPSSDISINELQLGSNLGASAFANVWATVDKTTELVIAQNQLYEVSWTVTVSN